MFMKKKVIMSLMAALVACALVGGATFAIFTDFSSAPLNDKVITAGTLDIDSYRDGFDTIPGPMFYTTPEEGKTPTEPSFDGIKPTGFWAPGDTKIRSLIVYNQGSLDAVLKQVKAEVIEDPANMASKMNVAIYQVLPEKDENGVLFAPLPGDDSVDQDLLNLTSSIINPFIIQSDDFFNVENLAQEFIENQIPANPNLLWTGNLTDLTAGSQDFNDGLILKKYPLEFGKRGVLLAFVVQFDKDANNDYQEAVAKFGFTVTAKQNQ